jgi:TP901 family phage tail tape measure protein
MAEDANARIRVDIDTAAALANIKNLQRQISAFHTSLAKSGAAASASSMQMQQSLLNSINRTGQFSATIKNVKTTTDSFTNSLEKNKLSMGEYFRYSGAATKTFGRFFRTEFDTINKVARERVKDLQTQYIKMGRDANGAMRAIAVRPLALDMENLSTKTQIAAQRQALLNQLLKQGSTNLLNFGKNTQWAGRQLMVGFTVPLVMLGSVAAKTFMDMEKQAVRFKRVYGEMFTTTEETDKAVQDIRNLANEFTKYGVAVAKTMELAADIAATGKMGAELNAQVAETTRLAVLGGVEQAEALQATISLTDAFGVSAEELAGKIDFLNAVENQTITSIEDLTIAIPKAGPVVQQLGGDVEDLTFFLTAMREGGINASEGANALKSGLAALINPTGKASEMLQGFGINIKGIVEANAGDVKGLVLDFASALDTLDPLNRARAIEQLFGKFQFSRLSTLFQNVIKEGNQASRVLSLANATTEELAVLSARELKKVEDSPMFKFQKAIEDIKVTLVPLGEAFLKAVTPILEFGTSILKKFDELDDGAKNFVVGLTAIAGVIGPVFLMGFGLIANGVANVVKGFVFFKTAMNKAGSASTQLGMQTEYMTKQQLEASAVAASLDQVHQKLRQTFTSEAIAVNGLTEAYRRAISAQVAMTGGAITRTRPPKGAGPAVGYASGVLSVPGPKGAGDVVPAMLSPGEAVIPARQAQKYSGFISSMIADNVPGFRFGRNPFAKFKSAVQPEGSKYGIGEGLLRLMTGNRLGPHGSEPNFWQDSIANKFIRSNPKIAVRMQDKDLLSLIGSKDKRYKSVFETKRSNAGDTEKDRAYAEERLFGLPQGVDPSKRPTYGYMFKEERGQRFIGRKQSSFTRLTGKKDRSLTRSAYQSIFKSKDASLMNPKTFRYGNTAMILKNRNIKDRTTFTYGDSYNRSLDRFGTPARLGTRNKDDIKGSYTSKDKDFFEAQIMGGFTLKDVKRIVVTEPHLVPLLQQALRQQGIKIPVRMPKFTMLQRLRSIVSNAGLYGTTLNAQGNRINHRYQNSELPVTQKDGSYGIKQERYIRRSAVSGPQPELNLAARLFKKMGIPGYKDGVFSVPGPKGAGDVVPAMLAPGEAVIPAKQSTKYQDLIRGIVAGNIPGYRQSVPSGIPVSPTGEDRLVSFPESMSVNSGHMAFGARDLTLDQATKLAYTEWRKGVRTGAFDRLGIDAKQVWRDYTAQIAAIRKSGASSIHQYPNLLDTITKTSNVATATVGASGLTAQQHADELARLPRGAFGSGVLARLPKNHGIPDSELRRYISNVERSYLSQLQAAEANSPGRRLTEAETNKFYSRATRDSVFQITDPKHRRVIKDSNFVAGLKMTPAIPGGSSSSGRTTRWLKSLGGNLQKKTRDIFYGRDKATNFMQRLFGDDFARVRGSRFLDQAGVMVPGSLKPQADAIMKSETLTNDQKARVANQLIDAKNENKPTAKRADRFSNFARILRQSPEALLAQGLNAASRSNSPSELLVETSAENMVDGVVQGIEDGKKDVTKAGKATTSAYIDGTERVRVTEKGQFYDRNTKKRISEAEAKKTMALDRQNEKSRERAAARKELRDRRAAGINQTYGISQKQYDSMSEEQRKGLRHQRNLNESKAKAVRAENANARDAERQRVANAKIAAEEKQQRAAARKERFSRIAGKVGGGASMAGMGAMMYGMTGGPGADIAMMASMPLMMAQMMGKLSPVILGLGGIAIAAIALKGAFDQAQTSTIKLTEALGTGDGAVEAFAEFAGKVSAGEIMDKRRQDSLLPFSVQTGKSTFGESFIQSDQGKSMAASTRDSIAKLGRSSTESQMVTQLVNAVSSGALDAGQARSIVSNIAKEIGDTSFGLSVNAKLVELLGVNGENLLNDPLTIRIKLAEDAKKQVSIVASEVQKLADPFQILGEAALSTGLLAGTGALVGGPWGAVAGTVAGIANSAPQVVSAFVNMGTASAALVTNSKMALQQQQQILDSLDLDYEKRIATAKAAGDLAKAEQLTNQYMLDRKDLLDKGAETRAAIATSFESASMGGKMAMQEAAKKSIENRFKDDADGLALAMGARQQVIDASGLNDTQEYMLTVGLASDLDPLVISQLMSVFGSDKATLTKTFNLMDNLGNGDTNRALNVMKMFVDDNGDPIVDQQTSFLAMIEAKSDIPEEARKYLAMFESVSRVLDAKIVMTYLNNNPEAADKMLEIQQAIDGFDGKMTATFVADLVGEGNMQAFREYEQYFNDLPDNFQKTFMTQFAATMLLEGDPDMIEEWRAWQDEEGNKGKSFGAFAFGEAFRTTTASVDNTAATISDEDSEPVSGGSGPAASSLDDVLKKLRDIRKNQVGVTKGFEASANAINKLFGGGAGINLFSGIENDMRRLGAEEDLITLIAGMDPEEFEKKKNTLFNFDRQTGEIIGFKEQLQNVGKALAAVALGQYVSDQQRSAKESRNQIIAFNQLRAAGYSVAEAYETIQDAAVASAVATGNVTRDQLGTMLQEFRNAQEAMKQAARLTPEGLQEVFEEGFNKAMEAFDVKERKLTLEYDLKIKDDQALVDQAQNQIATIRYQLDDYEADLRGIEDQEEAINKTYDDKLEALEKVRNANQKILDQEKGRLSVAEAITRGDLSAAAQAVQNLRETSASGYFSSQTDALNAGRQSALDAVRGENGLSRIEIEEKIKQLTNDIFNIEEKTLEPAQRRIDLAQIELEARIKELTELGKTKEEWIRIQNNIDLARVNSDGYRNAMQEAFEVVQDVLDAWNGVQSKEVVLTTIQRTVVEGATSTGYTGDGDGTNPDPEDVVNPVNGLTAAQQADLQAQVDRLSNSLPGLKTTLDKAKAELQAINNKPREWQNWEKRFGATKAVDDAQKAYDTALSKLSTLRNQISPPRNTPASSGPRLALASGGKVMSFMANGGSPLGSDTVPAMLTPGEFVVKRPMVNKYGTALFDSLNSGAFPNIKGMTSPSFSSRTPSLSVNQSSVPSRQVAPSSSNSVYNYSLSVNVASQSDPNTIAQTVMAQIQRIDSQRVGSGRF